ncbi:MAG: DnaJ domain-containing protein [Bacteroidetes bacterium]|nr:DnaJ domain-containing protein [Bacteroidota bacterium]MCB9074256.1 DnaJ domain-containing protein [Chitinophagales bacterium]
MFKDYYKILDIPVHATAEEVKQAFRNQAIRWHPDRNPNVDTTVQMQEINEAYLILKDAEARARYDIEYQRFNYFQQQQEQQREKDKTRQKEEQQTKQRQHTTTDYTVADDILKRWMDNAQKQAVALAQQTIRDMKGVVSAATSGCISGIIQLVIAIVVINLISLLFKSCN